MFDFIPDQTQMEIFQVKKWDKDDEYNGHKKCNICFKTHPRRTTRNSKSKAERRKSPIFNHNDGKFKADDKKEDILYFINNFNLASIFFCLDDLGMAKQYTKNLEASDKQGRVNPEFKRLYQVSWNKNGRHFVANTHLEL